MRLKRPSKLISFLLVIIAILSIATTIAIVQVSVMVQMRCTITAAYGLESSKSFIDWGELKLDEERIDALVLTNTGNKVLWVWWDTDLGGSTFGDYADMTLYYGTIPSHWAFNTEKVRLQPGEALNVEVRVKMHTLAPAATYTWLLQFRGDDTNT